MRDAIAINARLVEHRYSIRTAPNGRLPHSDLLRGHGGFLRFCCFPGDGVGSSTGHAVG
jgi:hypothetical protein